MRRDLFIVFVRCADPNPNHKPLPEAISVPNGFWVFEDGPPQRQV